MSWSVKGTGPEYFIRAAAKAIVDRANQRDSPDGERSMKRAVEAFNHLRGVDMSELDGWIFMLVLKMARAAEGDFNPDDYVDAIGYAALAGECAVLNHVPGPET